MVDESVEQVVHRILAEFGMRKLGVLCRLGQACYLAGQQAGRPEMKNAFECGILSALACVYCHDEGVIAEEIVVACDEEKLLRVAEREDDSCLPQLRATVAELKRKYRLGKGDSDGK